MNVKCCLKWVEKNNRLKDFFSKFGFSLNLGATILLLFSYLAPLVPPDSFWPLSFFGLAFPYLMVINIFFLMIWILQGSKKLLLPLISLLSGFNNLSNTLQLIPKAESKESGITILTYNVHNFRYGTKTSRAYVPKILEYFKSSGAEIICIQEAKLRKGEKLSPQAICDALPEINHYKMASVSSYTGSVTFSKYPIINFGEIRFQGSSNLVLYSDIQISTRQIIRLYNCHLQSYSIDPDDYSIIDSIRSGTNSDHIVEAKKISYKLIAGFKLRALQARKLADHIRKSPYPVVVCGDFNDTPVSYSYRKVRGEMKDAFVEAGWGISNTYNGQLPSFRIDYILCDQKFVVGKYNRDRILLSDHFPVRCQLSLK